MKKIFKKSISLAGLILLLLAGGFLAAAFQDNIIKIKADGWPIIVNTGHLAFGTVFPGEQAEKTFTVSYIENGAEESVSYTVVEKYKPRPGAAVPDGYSGSISGYCQEYFEDFEKCYRDLCLYIDEYTDEGEGDDAVVGASVSISDISDLWTVHLNAPAIVGNVAQDHTGGIISVNGEYGCDLFIDIGIEEDEPYCGDGNLDPGEECDDGNNNGGDGCSADCKTEGGNGGGGALVSLQVSSSEECVITEDGAAFSWTTNKNSSSRVVCGAEPNPDWGTPPDYGYTFFTEEYDKGVKVRNHKVEIPGLIPGESYYCRVISSDSSSVVFEEMICSIPEEEEEKGEVKGIDDVVIPKALPKTGFGRGF